MTTGSMLPSTPPGLNEFVASYFAYAFVSERKPESKRVFDLLGRPSKLRPKNTTLDDFERLYIRVDDYGWYQGMFERRIQELYPKMGLQFLKELKRLFPAQAIQAFAVDRLHDAHTDIGSPGHRCQAVDTLAASRPRAASSDGATCTRSV